MAILQGFKDLNASFKLAASTILLASAATVVFSLPNTAFAQDGAAGALLEEIVTTARKRSEAEAVQDVPIAVTAFGAAQIDALFVKKIDDLSYLMPNVQLEAVGTFPGVQNFSIRGQGINSSIPSVDPTVGVFVDGLYMGTTFGVVIDTFDLESVEVLRGPQGLLFGRNVTGGAVVIRNARPNGEFGTRFRVGATDADQYNVAAAIEGSLIDGTVAGKIVAYYDNVQGYFDGTVIGRDVGKMTFSTEPRPGLIEEVVSNPAEMETARLTPLMRRSPGFLAASGVTEQFGEIASASVFMGRGPGEGSLFAALFDAVDLVDELMGPVESLDASLAAPIAGVPESMRVLRGHMTLNLRCGPNRSAAVVVSDSAGQWHRQVTVLGNGGRLDINDVGIRWLSPTGEVLDQSTHKRPPTAGELVGMQILRRLNNQETPDAPPDHARTLALCEAARVSCRTRQSESPQRMLQVLSKP